ncbi:hypothetical protein D9M71_820380 [compost metagenome]
MPGEAQRRTPATAAGPEVVHILDVHRLHSEAAGSQALHHQLLAALVQRGDGGTANQLAGQFEGGGEGGHAGSATATDERRLS